MASTPCPKAEGALDEAFGHAGLQWLVLDYSELFPQCAAAASSAPLGPAQAPPSSRSNAEATFSAEQTAHCTLSVKVKAAGRFARDTAAREQGARILKLSSLSQAIAEPDRHFMRRMRNQLKVYTLSKAHDVGE